jgi:hypothetical protein
MEKRKKENLFKNHPQCMGNERNYDRSKCKQRSKEDSPGQGGREQETAIKKGKRKLGIL